MSRLLKQLYPRKLTLYAVNSMKREFISHFTLKPPAMHWPLFVPEHLITSSLTCPITWRWIYYVQFTANVRPRKRGSSATGISSTKVSDIRTPEELLLSRKASPSKKRFTFLHPRIYCWERILGKTQKWVRERLGLLRLVRVWSHFGEFCRYA